MVRKGSWLAMALAAALVASYALANALAPGIRTPFVEALFSDKALRAFGHLAAGGIALGVGGLQFSTRLRVTRRSLHRNLGRTYVAAVLASGISAPALAPTSSGGVAAHFGFGLLAVLWLMTTTAAFVTARNGAYETHREWMIRSYALCLAAVTLRIYLPVSLAAGVPFDEAYPAIAWLCWVPNLVVAEWLVVRGAFVPLEGVV